MEKPGIEPATPGLQGIALIHYTTGASAHEMVDALYDICTQKSNFKVMDMYMQENATIMVVWYAFKNPSSKISAPNSQ